MTQINEIIPDKAKGRCHRAKVWAGDKHGCVQDLAGKFKGTPRCFRLLSWFLGNEKQGVGAGREKGFLLVPEDIDRQWVNIGAKEMGGNRGGDGGSLHKPHYPHQTRSLLLAGRANTEPSAELSPEKHFSPQAPLLCAQDSRGSRSWQL